MATKKWKVAVGCDPNAAELKETIKELLKAEGHSFEDFGSDDPIYPNVAFKVGEAVASENSIGAFWSAARASACP